MMPPLRRMHQDDVRKKIKTSLLVKRLNDHAMGELELSPSQIKAIEVLIRKTLPDLAAVQLEGDLSVTTHKSIAVTIGAP